MDESDEINPAIPLGQSILEPFPHPFFMSFGVAAVPSFGGRRLHRLVLS
jgi:hypothetical protein